MSPKPVLRQALNPAPCGTMSVAHPHEGARPSGRDGTMALFGISPPPQPKPPAGSGGLVKDSTDQDFRADVLEESMNQPVLVDFWAPWCGPCRTLGPMLERAVAAAQGRVKLVKINIDEHPAYAGQLRVQSIPAVFAFDKGRPVDGFMGAQPESQIKAFIERLAGAAPAGVDDVLKAAAESLSLGDIGGAAQSFAEALALDPVHPKALAGLARCWLKSGQQDQARDALARVPADKANDPDVVSARAALDLALAAGSAGDADALAARVRAAPDDWQARYDLAQALIAADRADEAVDHLLAIFSGQRDWNGDAARKLLLKLFDAAGAGSDLAKSGRRRLSALMFA